MINKVNESSLQGIRKHVKKRKSNKSPQCSVKEACSTPSLPTYIFSKTKKKAPHIQISHNNCFKDSERNKRLAADSVIMCPQTENSQYIFCSCSIPYLSVHNDKWKAQASTDNSKCERTYANTSMMKEELSRHKEQQGLPTSFTGLRWEGKPQALGVGQCTWQSLFSSTQGNTC